MVLIKKLTAAFTAAAMLAGMNAGILTSGMSVMPDTAILTVSATNSASADWMQLYADKLRTYIDSTSTTNDIICFDLYDFNGDCIPELMVSPGIYHQARCTVFTIRENEIIELGDCGSYGTINFIEGKNYLLDSCNQGHSYIDIYSLNDDSISLIFDVYTEFPQRIGDKNAVHTINGVPSTKEDYEQELSLYYDEKNIVYNLGRRFTLNEAAIGKVFETKYTYKDSVYQVFDLNYSWTKANNMCKSLNGNLVSINTEAEQEFIEALLSKQEKNSYWTGGYLSDDTWYWTDDSKIEYTNWDSYVYTDGKLYQQPDNYSGDEYFIRISSRYKEYSDWLTNAGKWLDTSDTADGYSSGEAGLHTIGFVCEWNTNNIEPTTTTTTAATTTTTTAAANPDIPAEDNYSGECGVDGDNVTWEIDSSNILTISGEGKMEEWSGSAPWSDHFTKIVKVIIDDGVTNIGSRSFNNFIALESISIPDSVTSIGEYAFFDCHSLKSIDIPDGVTAIPVSTFYDCYSLNEITLGENVKSIEYGAFQYCTNLESVTIKNPECNILNHQTVFCNDYDFSTDVATFDGTIYGYADSTAQAYAEKFDRKFEVIGGEAPAPEVLIGDVDGDGKITASDATMTLIESVNISSGREPSFTDTQLKAADANEDGKLSTSDAQLILAIFTSVAGGKS